MTVRELNNRLQVIDVDELCREAVTQNASKLVTMNKRQLEVGETITGGSIKPSYRSRLYAKYKQLEMGSQSPLGTPDLKLTGDFHKGFFLTVEDNEYFIESSDEKTGMLVDKYKDIFGLTTQNKDSAKVFVTRTFGDLFKKASGLK